MNYTTINQCQLGQHIEGAPDNYDLDAITITNLSTGECLRIRSDDTGLKIITNDNWRGEK